MLIDFLLPRLRIRIVSLTKFNIDHIFDDAKNNEEKTLRLLTLTAEFMSIYARLIDRNQLSNDLAKTLAMILTYT